MYGECGRIDEATAVFDNLPHPNLYSWTMLMKAYIKNDCDKEALDCLNRMRLCGVEPDHVTFVCTLEACASLGTLKKGQEIHAAIVDCGYEKKVIVGNALINMYGKCGSLNDAKEVFAQMTNRNEASWNAMISVCAQNGRGREALELFDFMRCEGIKPSSITYLCALDACASMAALEKGHEIHSAVVQGGYEGHVIVGTALVNMYGKCRSLDDARSVFRQITKRDTISWNAMITACSQNGHCEEALDLFNQMQHEGAWPNQVTLICVLDACASLSFLKKGQEIHATIINRRYTKNLLVCNALINMYGKCGSVEKARWVFGQMPQKDAISWNSIIAACTQNGKSTEALNLLDCMQRDGFKPSQITFLCALEACASVAALVKGQEVHAAILDSGYEVDVLLGNALVNMYGKCGSLEDARSVFDQMLHRDVISWSSMIEACAQNGHGMEALKLFHQMQSEGINPNRVTFLSILSACSHMGYVDHGRHCFESMSQNHGLSQKAEHYVCLIDSLSRAGHLDAAEDLIDAAI
ncbi:hypothetical protein O6H91_01G018100 [Diphasiastrum complanatum]|nr:hypothetical protein O6H91_01G018100 [Diphasiastrum complanatum]